MNQELAEIVEMSGDEANQIRGGDDIRIALFIVDCFKAGYHYGFNVVGPALFPQG